MGERLDVVGESVCGCGICRECKERTRADEAQAQLASLTARQVELEGERNDYKLAAGAEAQLFDECKLALDAERKRVLELEAALGEAERTRQSVKELVEDGLKLLGRHRYASASTVFLRALTILSAPDQEGK